MDGGPQEAVDASEAGCGTEIVTADPVQYPQWDELVAAYPGASIFHGSGWAKVLQKTYGHRPFYFCRFKDGQLAGLLPVMEVESRLTGRRGVSLPFTDFCAPLSRAGEDSRGLYQAAMEAGRKRNWKFLECRSADENWVGRTPSLSFFGHAIDLGGGVNEIFKRMDSAVRRGIRKAEGAGLQVEFSGSEEAVRTYYGLHCQTRRRHGLPPQPFRFFENIQRYLLAPGGGFIVVARLKEKALAGAAFFCYRGRALYKFGASDYRFQHLRPNNLLMWAAMRHCAERGLGSLHLGRTSLGNEGLRRFKLALGATEETINYSKYDFRTKRFVTDRDRVEGWFNRVFAALPGPLLRLAGEVLYPHLS